MKDLIQQLKARAQQASPRDADLFELLLTAACRYCCTEYTGGNESCPPKVALEAGA